MSGELTEAVLAGGVFFPAGTPRRGDAAQSVPDGPWWSGPAEPDEEVPASDPEGGADDTDDDKGQGEGEQPDTPAEPPRSGKGSGVDEWRAYAAARGVEVPDGAGRDDIIAAIDAL